MKIILKFIKYIFIIPITLIIILISKFFLIRFFLIKSNRLGHFIAEPELLLCEKRNKINKPNQLYIDFAFLENRKKICNKYLYKIIKRYFLFLPEEICFSILNIMHYIDKIFNTNYYYIHSAKTLQNDLDIKNLFMNQSNHIKLNNNEISIGTKFLKDIGIKKNTKFVCLIVRDNKYLDINIPDINHDYHSYRDSDILIFEKVIMHLINLGYFVFRMGREVNQHINIKHSNFYDYAISNKKNDLLDIFLGSKCEFCITTGTGFDAIPYVFRRPLISLIMPIGLFYSYNINQINITKKHFSKKLNRYISLSEIFKCGLAFAKKTSDFKKLKVELIDFDPDEIIQAVDEMIESISQNFDLNEEKLQYHRKFTDIFKKNIEDNIYYSNKHGKLMGRYSISYIKKNDWFLK